MKRKHYFPSPIAEQRAWLVNYKAKIAIYGPVLGLSAAEITEKQDLCQKIIDAIDKAIAAMTEAKEKNTAKNLTMKDCMAILRPSITNIKSNTAYVDTMGVDMKIIGEETTFDPATAKTVVNLSKAPQGVDIKFVTGFAEGGNIYCKRGKETEFTFLKYITHPHTIDTRPNLDSAVSEQRQYYIILVLHDFEIGIPSDIATIKN